MDQDAQSYADRRRAAIEEAAYALLAEKGYKATSMLAIARRAKASNETLYRWYGNKQDLFRSLVEKNAASVTGRLESLLSGPLPEEPLDVLIDVGIALLTMLTSERAIALNRAAAGDVHDTGKLGKTLNAAGRQTVRPILAQLFARLAEDGALRPDTSEAAATVWLSVLIGDIQIQLVTGARATANETEIKERAARARQIIAALYAAG